MLDQMLEVFAIVPAFDLALMTHDQSASGFHARSLEAMTSLFSQVTPDLILVHGDTTSSLTASLAGFYSKIPVAHVEAGLRTHNLSSPFPEEMNRQLISRLAGWHFAPTDMSRDNLIREGIRPDHIFVTGNTIIDSLTSVFNYLTENQDRLQGLESLLDLALKFDWKSAPFVLVTGHRRENLDGGLEQVCRAIKKASETFPDLHFVYPVHLNPNVEKIVVSNLLNLNNVHLVKPLDYVSFIYLMKYCLLVLTDSGGIQEEAPALGKKVLLFRDNTERPEGVLSGDTEVIGADESRIFSAISQHFLSNPRNDYSEIKTGPFGDGQASERILQSIFEILNLK